MKDSDFSLLLAHSVHDMKNSLSAIIQSLDNILPDISENQQHQAGSIRYEASRISNAMVQLLSLYKLDHEFLNLHVQEVFIMDLLENLQAEFEQMAQERQIQISIECDPDLSFYLDPVMVEGSLKNLVSNSIRYAQKAIQLSASLSDQNDLVIEVADDGSGYSEKIIKQAGAEDQEVDFGSGSTGLGLYFVRRIAALHQNQNKCGRVHLENGGPLAGGVFQLILP